jgi:hypothetical protein
MHGNAIFDWLLSDYQKNFPRLERLSLPSGPDLNESQLAKLPVTLTSLELNPSHDSFSLAPLNLPSLTFLKAQSNTISRLTAISMLPALQTLILTRCDSLPNISSFSNLRHLACEYTLSASDLIELPSELESLAIRYEPSDEAYLDCLPRKLTSLTFTYVYALVEDYGMCSIEEVKSLPLNLLYWKAGELTLEEGADAFLPASLLVLECAFAVCEHTVDYSNMDSDMGDMVNIKGGRQVSRPKLPPNLTSFHYACENQSNDDIMPIIPATLTALNWDSMFWTLKHEKPTSNSLALLPSSLTSLCCDLLVAPLSSRPDQIPAQWKEVLVPKALTELDVSIDALVPLTCLMGPCLVRLRLEWDTGPESSTEHLGNGWSELLPPSLTYLWVAPPPNAIGDAWFQSLCTPNLASLILSEPINPNCAIIEHLEWLPTSLTELELKHEADIPHCMNWKHLAKLRRLGWAFEGTLPSNFVDLLPPRLVQVSLSSSSGRIGAIIMRDLRRAHIEILDKNSLRSHDWLLRT